MKNNLFPFSNFALLVILALLLYGCGDSGSSNSPEEISDNPEQVIPLSSSEQPASSDNADISDSGTSAENGDSSSSFSSATTGSSNSSQGTSSNEGSEITSSGNNIKEDSSSSDDVGVESSTSSTIEYGELIDARDGQVYRTVRIGNNVWMAENLNYDYQIDGVSYGSYIYGDDVENLNKYGRYYTWAAAMDSAGLFSNGSKGCGNNSKVCYAPDSIQGVCPEKWHVPMKADFEDLLEHALSDEEKQKISWYHFLNVSLPKLRSTSGWDADGNGTDDYGFSILPSGFFSSFTGDHVAEPAAWFWTSEDYFQSSTSTSNGKYGVYYLIENYSNNRFVPQYPINKDGAAISIRCVQGVGSIASHQIEYGSEIIDVRDGQHYKTVKIGNQTWMAENMNYEYKAGEESFCRGDSLENCQKYGRIYTLKAAKEICPSGYHLPDTTEWNELFNAVGGKDVAGLRLSEETDGLFGFFAKPAGGVYLEYSQKPFETIYFWSSDQMESSIDDEHYTLWGFAYLFDIAATKKKVIAELERSHPEHIIIPVRCVKD